MPTHHQRGLRMTTLKPATSLKFLALLWLWLVLAASTLASIAYSPTAQAAASLIDSNSFFIAQQYRDFLNREADTAGANYWASQLATGTQRAALSEQFIRSAEFDGRVAPVVRLYKASFLRVPDYDGAQYWIGRYTSGVSLANIAQTFATSTEFTNRYGALSNDQFVALLYRNAFGRDVDATGRTYWVTQLNGTLTRGGMMLGLSESVEFKAKEANATIVTMAYIGFLRRTPEDAGYAFWLNDLNTTMAAELSAKTQQMLGQFIVSDEYRARFPASVPGAPTIGAATAGNASASIAFTTPTSTGSSAITGYSATCVAVTGRQSGTGTASPIIVSGLTNGTAYSCSVSATNIAGTSVMSSAVLVTPAVPVVPIGGFTLTSSVGLSGGVLPSEYTCDGTGATLPLAWSGAPAGTTEYAVLMTTLPGDGTTKWNWVLYGIPGTTKALAKDTFGLGELGVGSDGPNNAYNPPCSQGTGAKVYTYTVYALSSSPIISVTPNKVTGPVIAEAIKAITLGSASLELSATRTNATGSAANCVTIRNSTQFSTTGAASVSCDATYAYLGSNGLATHAMMNGITATNLQVPIAQNFGGANAWKIPLAPAIAATTTTANDGPIGVAINGVPIFNPCKQGGCQNGDTKVLGELDVCNGHAGRADDYHYHAAPTCMMAGQANPRFWDTHPVGWALDGFAIFGFNNADGSVATRDTSCGGNTLPVTNGPAGYSYHLTEASPYVLSCFRGTPSPDLANQGSKYVPLRKPPVTPFPVGGMSLTTDSTDGYQVLQFSSARAFTATENGTDQYPNPPGTYRIRYKAVSGAALSALLEQAPNANKTACWNFQFVSGAGATTQPSVAYCR